VRKKPTQHHYTLHENFLSLPKSKGAAAVLCHRAQHLQSRAESSGTVSLLGIQ